MTAPSSGPGTFPKTPRVLDMSIDWEEITEEKARQACGSTSCSNPTRLRLRYEPSSDRRRDPPGGPLRPRSKGSEDPFLCHFLGSPSARTSTWRLFGGDLAPRRSSRAGWHC